MASAGRLIPDATISTSTTSDSLRHVNLHGATLHFTGPISIKQLATVNLHGVNMVFNNAQEPISSAPKVNKDKSKPQKVANPGSNPTPTKTKAQKRKFEELEVQSSRQPAHHRTDKELRNLMRSSIDDIERAVHPERLVFLEGAGANDNGLEPGEVLEENTLVLKGNRWSGSHNMQPLRIPDNRPQTNIPAARVIAREFRRVELLPTPEIPMAPVNNTACAEMDNGTTSFAPQAPVAEPLQATVGITQHEVVKNVQNLIKAESDCGIDIKSESQG